MPKAEALNVTPSTITPPVGNGPTGLRQKAASLLGKAGYTPTSLNSVVDAGTDFLANSIMGNKRNESINPMQQTVQNGIINGLGYIPGVGPLVKNVVKAANAIQYATNSQVDAMTKDQANKADVSGLARVFNNTMATLPATFAGRLYGATDDAYVSREAEQSRGSFADSLDKIDTAQGMGGKNILAGRLKFNNYINDANYVNDIITRMKRTNTMHSDNSVAQDIAAANNRMYAGASMASDRMYAGKQGMKMASLKEAQEILKARQVKEEEVPIFQNGGVIGVDTNILPEGALHAHKNHLEEANEELGSQVTEKGIPVIVTDAEGNPSQVAEIEKEEIVFRSELTKKIEEL